MNATQSLRPASAGVPVGVPVGLLATTAAVLAVLMAQGRLTGVLAGRPGVQLWLTVLVSIALQALPFLVLGVLLSAAVATLLPVGRWLAALPGAVGGVAGVPVAALAGALLPGCECASVPLAGSLVARGVPPGPALALMLAAPGINPLVLTSTAVAFAGQPRVVVARFVASLLTAVGVGLLWRRTGAQCRAVGGRDHDHDHDHGSAVVESRSAAFPTVLRRDLLRSGGFLAIGAAAAATAKVALPRGWLAVVGARPVLAVVVAGALAFAVAICSQADAFVAVSLTALPLTARLAFMVVGPAVDVKLVAMHVATFGSRFAVRFAAVTFVAAVLCAGVVGTVLC